MSNSPADGTQQAKADGDVQSYLIAQYREALKSGDKSYAKSCLLSTRLFSVDDPNITNEIYLMAKSDGDASEAAKCFANVFNQVCVNSLPDDDSWPIIDQVREEIRLLVNELKANTLKLRSNMLTNTTTISSGQQTRQAPSVCQSPMLSPRRRMASEDRAVGKDSVYKLGNHLHSTTKSFFYQQLFDNLPVETRKEILDYWTNICLSGHTLEQCRSMILSILLFNETIQNFGIRLLQELSKLSDPLDGEKDNQTKLLSASAKSPAICHYAKSILVLDAIPLVFSIQGHDNLISRHVLNKSLISTFNFYSEYCLEGASSEYEFEELHEGLKKTIATRILGKEGMTTTPDDLISENLNNSLNLMLDRYLQSTTCNDEQLDKLKKLRLAISERNNKDPTSFDSIMDAIKSLNIENDIPESILFQIHSPDDTPHQLAPTNNTPPKSRGRPKKSQSTVIVSPDYEVVSHLRNKSFEAYVVFYSLIQFIFQNSSQYLKATKSRVLMCFDNPLPSLIGTEEQSRISSQRSSRSKNSSQESVAKKAKIENNTVDKSRKQIKMPKDSPLNSESSKKLDLEILTSLKEIHLCIDYLLGSSPTMTRIWEKFKAETGFESSYWFSRVHSDSMIISVKYTDALDRLEQTLDSNTHEPQIRKDLNDTETSTLTVTTGLPAVHVKHLRAATQMISCSLQIQDKTGTYQCIDDLLTKLRLSGLLNKDGSYSAGNIIEEYMTLIEHESTSNDMPNYGFLFFDTLSMIRYVVGTLSDLLRMYSNYWNATSDLIVGHTIILSQLDWPKEAPLYERCIAWLRSNKPRSITPQCLSASTKFTYPHFFQYITDPNIIEDFMALLIEGYTLDITAEQVGSGGSSRAQSQSTGSSSASSERASSRAGGKTMTTRGVNRNFKDQLKLMLADQMEHSSCLVPLSLIAGFIQTLLLAYLHDSPRK